MQAEKHIPPKQVGLLAETSWEVCNKIGGIYTVLSTKAKVLKEKFGDDLVFIGPDVWTKENPSPYFKENKNLLKSFAKKSIDDFNISVRCGRWTIPGSPQVILVKFDGVYPHLNSLFGTMWEKFGVDSMHEYGDYREGCAFAIASAVVIRNLAEHLGRTSTDVYAHFNEWTTGMGLLYLRLIMPQAASLFTTHATSIGRSICGNGKPLYDYFEGYNGDQMAVELNMEAKHSLEKTAAKEADCFTAVSEITAKEATKLLDVAPQVITPNGFEPGFVPGDVKFRRLRKAGREKLLSIAKRIKGKSFGEETIIIATSGRNEYRNKGLDLYLDSLSQIEKLGIEKNILALVLVPAWVSHPISDHRFITHMLHNMDSDMVACRLDTLLRDKQLDGQVDVIYIPCYLDGRDGVVDISYYDLLPAIDITIFPSYYEPWGYTPLESIAFGIPTITSDKSGFGQWILSNFGNSLFETGVKVVERSDSNYPESAYEIAKEVKQFSETEDEKKAKIRTAAFSTAEKADWKYFLSYYMKAFEVAETRRNQRI